MREKIRGHKREVKTEEGNKEGTKMGEKVEVKAPVCYPAKWSFYFCEQKKSVGALKG